MYKRQVFICNRSRARLVHSGRNRAFWRGYPNLMHLYEKLLEPRGPKLTPLRSTFNAEHFMCRLSWSMLFNIVEWFRRNSLLKCASQHKIAKKIDKNPYFWVQGRSRSSMLVPLESSSAVLVMICSKYVSICNRFYARRDNTGKIMIFVWGGTPIWWSRSRGISSPSGTKLPH